LGNPDSSLSLSARGEHASYARHRSPV
jgi:hypothetical protein